jgi:uncharacterized protein YdhG (YjbR/CyaY superfamily)
MVLQCILCIFLCILHCIRASPCVKNASLPEYPALLRQVENGRLQEVLGQTDACLRQLAEKLGWQVSVVFDLMGVCLRPPSVSGAAVLFFVHFFCICAPRCVKNASLAEYLALLRQAKNGRLQEVLGQTDACLRQLAESLGVAGGPLRCLTSGQEVHGRVPATASRLWCCYFGSDGHMPAAAG